MAWRKFRPRSWERVAQSSSRQHCKIIERWNPLGLLVETLIAPGAGSSGSGARLLEVNAVTSTNDQSMRQCIGKSETRLDGSVEGIVVVAILGTCKDLTAFECERRGSGKYR